MASRRLDISSLLCDDNQPPPFSPLDVLVAAATEERKRLDAGPVAHSPPQPTPPQPQLPVPVYDHHEHAHRVLYPPQSQPAPARQLSQYEPDRRRHSQGTSSQDRAEYLEFQRRQQEIDRRNLLRAQELGRRHKEEEERRRMQMQQQQEYERQFQLQQQQQRELELRAREERIREREREILTREDERGRGLEHHRELELRELDRQRLLERRDLERREQERRDREQREHLHRENSERQRDSAEQRELSEYQRLEDVRRRQQALLEHPTRPATLPSTTHSPSISYLITHSPPTRKTDHLYPLPSPSSILLDPPVIAIPSASHDDPRPIKKRRYSQSPTRPITDDKERIARERDKMSVGELGYGRVESPAVAPSAPPRRPGSGNGHTRKPVAVSDLLVDKERPPQPSRSRSRDREAQQVLSPLGGRRSPPGSQIGRAKAARKSDDFLLREPPPLPVQHQVVHITAEADVRKHKDDSKTKPEFKQPRHRPSSDSVRSPEELKPKKISTNKEIPLPPPPSPASTSTKSHPPSSRPHPQRKQEDDAHEWFLQHFDEDPSPTMSSRPEPPHTPSPSASPVTPNHPASAVVQPAVKSPPSSHKSLTPITAAVLLEEELEDLVSKPVSVTSTFQTPSVKQADDMDLDVDLAVTELVNTLDDGKHESAVMEVDVEDELLSLVDDRRPQPPPAPLSNAAPTARRVAGPSVPIANSAPPPHGSGSMTASGALSHHPHQTSSGAPVKAAIASTKVESAKQSPEIPHPASPLPSMTSTPAISAASLNVSRHTSSRPTPERGSMPPPASTTVGAKKSTAERAGSVAPPAITTPSSTPSGTAAPKKKKETSGAKASSSKAKSGTTGAANATAAAKPRAKAAAKSKKVEATPVASTSMGNGTASKTLKPPVAAGSKKGAVSTSASRSRSTSVMPNGAGASVGPENDGKAEKPDEEADGAEDSDGTPAEDDKLYCVCKTKYDEDRVMIACDRCDDWYHTNCLHMSDLEVDLVDQFICPPCVEKNPHLHLRTTYKQRCLYGLRHPDPNSPKACHKAARGAFSKYCSDECGVKYMQSRIDTWAKKGGKTDKLWESVKGADKREGVVCAVESDNESSALSEEEDEKPTAKPKVNGDAKHASPAACSNMDVDTPTKAEVKSEQKPDLNGTKEKKKSHKQKQHLPYHIKTHLVPPSKSKVARETERLNDLLDSVLKLREELKRGMEIVVWRERLLQLATERAEMVDQCGWDQRLCMDDQEWEDSGAAAMESYEDLQAKAEAAKEQGTSMEVDGAEEQWWCPGNKVCSRHQGWQTVRYKDIAKEKEKNDEALSKLTTREREIRKRIEDMLDPQKADTATTTPAATSSKDETSSRPTLKATNKAAVNGHSKAKAAATSTDATGKKGKKRKAPTA